MNEQYYKPEAEFRGLRKRGSRSILYGLLILVLGGFVVGLFCGPDGQPYITVVGVVGAIMVLYGMTCYAKGKGYSSYVGVGLYLLNVIGLIILLLLKDKSKPA